MTYHRIFKKDNTTGAISEAGTALGTINFDKQIY